METAFWGAFDALRELVHRATRNGAHQRKSSSLLTLDAPGLEAIMGYKSASPGRQPFARAASASVDVLSVDVTSDSACGARWRGNKIHWAVGSQQGNVKVLS